MIFKVQISLTSSDDEPYMLIYNKSKKIFYQDILDPIVKNLMNGKEKAYFKGTLVGTQIHLMDEVEPQKW
jgi:hypothetical protein